MCISQQKNACSAIKAINSINEAVEGLKSGNSIAVFPEGNRGKGPKIGSFKPDSLRIAPKSGGNVISILLSE